jgi:cytochrome bd ubiquinol oxidase subunit II
VMWTCFPKAFGPLMETLYVPLFLAAVGIIFRGAAFALRGEAATISEARALGATFALSSVLVPFFLGATVGAVASGQVPLDGSAGEFSSWTNATALLAGVLAVMSGAHLAAVFMAADASRAGFADLVDAFRRRAIGTGIVTGALAIAGLAVVNSDAPDLYDGLTSGGGLAMVIVSGLAGVTTLGLVWVRRFGPARFVAAVAVGSILVAMALAMRPDFLPGELSFADAAAGDSTLILTLISVALGLCIILPSLAFLFRLVLEGRLQDELKPIGSSNEGDSA